jgi:hypothetical protein
MEDRGFTFGASKPTPPSEKAAPMMPRQGTLGLLSDANVRSAGYYVDRLEFLRQIGRGPVVDEGFATPQYEETLKGVGGCEEQAHSQFNEGLEDIGDVEYDISGLDLTAEDRAVTGTRYQAALVEWVDCMAKAGWDFETPIAAVEFFEPFDGDLQPGQTPPPMAGEVEAAQKDLECKKSSRLVDVYREEIWNNLQHASDENRPLFEKLRAYSLLETERANEIIASLDG